MSQEKKAIINHPSIKSHTPVTRVQIPGRAMFYPDGCCICIFFCLIQGGIYMIQIIDNFAATYSLLIIGLFECVALSYVYGIDNFFKDIEMMIGRKPTIWWRIMWRYVTPTLLFVSDRFFCSSKPWQRLK